jgi:hypothetical protein
MIYHTVGYDITASLPSLYSHKPVGSSRISQLPAGGADRGIVVTGGGMTS